MTTNHKNGNVICSSWEGKRLPLPAFQSIISRLSVARRVPEKIEVERSPTVADLVLMVQTAGSQELVQLGNHGAPAPFRSCEEGRTPKLWAIVSKHCPLVTLPGVKGPWSACRRKSA